jgi:hypothetical protein
MPASTEPFAVPMKVARMLLGNRSPTTVYDLIDRGELIAVKDGKRTLIVLASIRARQEALPRITFKPPLPRHGRNRRGRK